MVRTRKLVYPVVGSMQRRIGSPRSFASEIPSPRIDHLVNRDLWGASEGREFQRTIVLLISAVAFLVKVHRLDSRSDLGLP